MKYTSTHWNVPRPSGKWRLTNPSQDKKTCHRFLPINWSPNGWPKNLEKHRSCQGPVGRLQPSHPKIPINASPKKTGRNFQVSRETLESRQFIIWGFLKWWVSPTTMGLPTKNDQHLGCELGVPPFKETPICRVYYTDYILAKWGDDIPPFQKLAVALFTTCSTTNIHWISRSNVRWIYYVGFPGVDSEIWLEPENQSQQNREIFSIETHWFQVNHVKFWESTLPKIAESSTVQRSIGWKLRFIWLKRSWHFMRPLRIFGLKWPWTIHLLSSSKCSSSSHGPVLLVWWLAAYHSTKLDNPANDMGNSSQEITCLHCGNFELGSPKGSSIQVSSFGKTCEFHIFFDTHVSLMCFWKDFWGLTFSVFESFSLPLKTTPGCRFPLARLKPTLFSDFTGSCWLKFHLFQIPGLQWWLRITFKNISQYRLRLVTYVSNYVPVHRGLCRFMSILGGGCRMSCINSNVLLVWMLHCGPSHRKRANIC